MKKYFSLSCLLLPGAALAAPLVGVDFSNASNGNDQTPDDLDLGDSITVSAWSFEGTGGITFDGNSNTGRATAPFGKFNGPTTDGTPPAVGSVPPIDGIHRFSITIGADEVNLTKISFDFSAATGSGNRRWLAFRTSLDDNLIFSELGPARPNLNEAAIDLSGVQYEGLSNQTVDFIWYAGGEGSGDIDIDNILVEGFSTADSDADGMADAFEQTIIDADPDDGITTIEDVLPGDDFDSDLSTNLEEFERLTDGTDSDSDDDGYFDGIETGDGSFDDIANDTGTDPLDADTDDDGLPDGVETNDGTFDDIATDTGSNPLEPDSDFDTLPDGYEAENGLDPGSDDSAEDPDSDDSSNLEEFARNTDPNNPDTDGDGASDGAETDTGTFVSLEDTGTDPLDPDTDNDGLLDGVETNDGSFNGAEDTGSDPHNNNTDDDNFRDGAEVNLHGTDPTDDNSFPVINQTVLFLAASNDTIELGTWGADEVALELLEDKFGIDKVTIQTANTVLPGDELAFDVVVFSSTPGSGDYRNKYLDSAVPIVNWEEAVIDNGAGEFGATTSVHAKSNQTTQMNLSDHPIANGLPEVIDLYAAANGEMTMGEMGFGDLAVVGTAANGNSTGGNGGLIGADVTGFAMVIAIDEGDQVDPLGGTTDNTAPARRVMLPFTDNTLNFVSDDVVTLFYNSLDWALGDIGGATPLAITGFELDQTSQPGNTLASITFTSNPGQTYSIFTSDSLFDLSADDGDFVKTVTGEEGTTTATVNFNVDGVADDPKRFFIVQEGAP